MASAETDKMLREMASVRGYRLVKSRRRKPGGDYGRYGLTDRAGKACFGIGDHGLKASAKEIADFLRGRAQSDWKSSLSAADEEPEPTRRRAARPPRQPKPEPAPRSSARHARAPDPEPPSRRRKTQREESPPPQRELPLLATVKPPVPEKQKPKSEPRAKPKPELEIREANSRDASGIAALIEDGVPPSPRHIAATMATLEEQGTPVLVAHQDGIVGAVSYDVLLPLHHGAPLGRITFITTAKAVRRKGIGGKLLEAAEERLSELGCDAVELVNPIEVSNANQFLRGRDYQRSGYRFIKLVDD